MKKGKISQLYRQILLSFLSVALFLGAVLTCVTFWFAQKNESDILMQKMAAMDTANNQLSAQVLSIYDMCVMLMENHVVKDHLRAYSDLSRENLYQYRSIIDLLKQSRLQFGSVVDSVFLFADNQRVLYSCAESGMTDFDSFFGDFMIYQRFDADFWRELLESGGTSFTILDVDVYHNGSRLINDIQVLPLVYITRAVSGQSVLVVNLSLNKILNLLKTADTSSGTLLAAYHLDGNQIAGAQDLPAMEQLKATTRIRYQGRDYFVFSVSQVTLDLRVFMLIPASSLLDVTASYRSAIFSLVIVFIAFDVLLALILSSRTYVPIRRLCEDVVDVVPSSPLNNEIHVIHSAISQLVSEREIYRARDRQHVRHYVQQGFIALLDGRDLKNQIYFSTLLTQEYHFHREGFRCADLLLECVSKFPKMHFRRLFRHFCAPIPRLSAAKPSSFPLELTKNPLETAIFSF